MSCVLIAYPTTEAESLISRYNARCDSDGAVADTQSTCALDAILALFGEQKAYVVDTEDFDIALTYSIQDVQEPSKRRGAFSKTITLPSTDTNNALFGHAYNIQSYFSGFDSTKRIRVNVWDNGIQIFTGVMRLLMVKRSNGVISYEVGLYGDEVNLFKDIDGKLLTDLDLSDLDHTLIQETVINSWTSGFASGFVYGLVDSYGYTDVRPNFGASAMIVPMTTLTPSVYSKQYVDRIFSAAGFRYSSAFLDSEQFKKEVVPYAKDFIKINLDDYRAFLQLGNDGMTGEDLSTASGVIQFTDDTPAPYTNTVDLQWDTTAFDFTNLATAVSRYKISVNLFLNINALTDIAVYIYDKVAGAEIARFDNGSPNFRIYQTGDNQIYSGVIEVQLNPAQEIDIRIDTIDFSRIVLLQSSSTVLFEPINVNFDGMPVEMNEAIPEKITQTEFLIDLKNRYNLMFYAAPEDPKLIYIEPYTDFFTSGVVDWSQKVDENSDIEIITGDKGLRRQFVFGYSNGGDALNNLYFNDYNEVYGTRKYVTDTFQATQVETITLKCATVIPASFNIPIPIGRTFALDANNEPQSKQAGYRVAQYNHITPSVSGTYWALFDGTNILNPSNYIAQTKIPLVAHIDNPYAPTFDLAFGIPSVLYYSAYNASGVINYTDNNLFNKYWLNYVKETTSKEAMQVTLSIVLDALDIYQLDFRRLIYIGGVLWKLVEVSDYVVGQTQAVSVTLRRSLTIPPFVGELISVGLGTGASIREQETQPISISSLTFE